jgi:hypothetical protein
MLRILPNHLIDKERWDSCIEASAFPLPYCYSWYLDLACPGWDCIADEDYHAVAPLPHKSKAGVKYVYQPFFTQQFGLFYNLKYDIDFSLLQQEFYTLLKSYASYIHLQLHANHIAPVVFHKVNARTTYLLSLNRPYAEIEANYSNNLIRNLKKFTSAIQIKTTLLPDNLIQLFRSSKADEVNDLKQKDYQVLAEIIQESGKRNHGLIWEAHLNDKCVAASFVLYNHAYVINLFNASNREGRQVQAMSVIFNDIIKHFSNSNRTFDFEGSDIPGVAAFYKTFGSQPQTYWHIMLNQLPWHLRILKNIKDGLQHR